MPLCTNSGRLNDESVFGSIILPIFVAKTLLSVSVDQTGSICSGHWFHKRYICFRFQLHVTTRLDSDATPLLKNAGTTTANRIAFAEEMSLRDVVLKNSETALFFSYCPNFDNLI